MATKVTQWTSNKRECALYVCESNPIQKPKQRIHTHTQVHSSEEQILRSESGIRWMLPTDVKERSGFRGARPRKEGIGLGSGREILRRREGRWRGGCTVYEDEEGRDDLREDMLHVVVLDQVLGKAAIFGDWKLLLLSLSGFNLVLRCWDSTGMVRMDMVPG